MLDAKRNLVKRIRGQPRAKPVKQRNKSLTLVCTRTKLDLMKQMNTGVEGNYGPMPSRGKRSKVYTSTDLNDSRK